MAALTCTALSLPTTISGPGIPSAPYSSPAANGGVFAFGNGSVGADTLAGATLAAILPAGPLKTFFSTTFTDIPLGDNAATQAQKAFAALGGSLEISGFSLTSGASAIALTCTSAAQPNLTATTTAATGFLRVRLTASIAA